MFFIFTRYNCTRFNVHALSFSKTSFLSPELHHSIRKECRLEPISCNSDSNSDSGLHSPIALLKQETRFLSSILLVALWLMDAVAIARVLPVEILLEYSIKLFIPVMKLMKM